MTTIERKHKTEVQRSEFGFERRGKGVSAVFGIRRSLAPETEPNGLCSDEGVWDAFFWQAQKKAPQEARNRPRLHHPRPAASRDVEDAVPYGWVVCKAPLDCGIT